MCSIGPAPPPEEQHPGRFTPQARCDGRCPDALTPAWLGSTATAGTGLGGVRGQLIETFLHMQVPDNKATGDADYVDGSSWPAVSDQP